MNASRYAAKLRLEMEQIKESMADPGYDDFTKYRMAVARYQTLKWARQELNIATTEDDEAGT